MAYRKILVPFSGSDRDAGILSVSADVAKKFDAFCQVLFIRPEPYQVLPYLGNGSPGLVIPEVVESMNRAAEAASDNVYKALEQAARDHGVEIITGAPPSGRTTLRFSKTDGEAGDVAARSSWLSDLAIFVGGQSDASYGVSQALVSVLLSAGRPILVLPRSDYSGTVGRKVTIAWDGSAEAANAIMGALPFLKQAQSIKVISAQEDLDKKSPPAELSNVLSEYFTLHSLKYSQAFVDPQDRSIGKVILEQATIDGSDLMVMGAYGHSRVREMILGGVTQYILEHATIPVLMAH